MGIAIRKMSKDDFDAVLALGGNLIDLEDLVVLEPGGPLDLSFVAEIDGQVVGFNLARIQYVGIPLTKVCVIGGVVVEHAYRRHGIGYKLIDEMFKYCREDEVLTVRALVDINDEQLRRFIESLGFNRSAINNYDMTLSGVSHDS